MAMTELQIVGYAEKVGHQWKRDERKIESPSPRARAAHSSASGPTRCSTLVALTLMIAESRMEEMDMMVKVIVNLINKNNQ